MQALDLLSNATSLRKARSMDLLKDRLRKKCAADSHPLNMAIHYPFSFQLVFHALLRNLEDFFLNLDPTLSMVQLF